MFDMVTNLISEEFFQLDFVERDRVLRARPFGNSSVRFGCKWGQENPTITPQQELPIVSFNTLGCQPFHVSH